MARKQTQITFMPSKRNGHVITDEDAVEIKRAWLDMFADRDGVDYTLHYKGILVYDSSVGYVNEGVWRPIAKEGSPYDNQNVH